MLKKLLENTKNEKMMKDLSALFFIIIFCSSCQEQCKTDLSKDSTNSESKDVTSSRIDTIVMANAPSRITRKIRKDKEGSLLMASFTDVLRYDGKTFSKIPKPDGFESFDAFDALEDSKGNIWIASTHYGVFRYDGKNFTHLTPDDGLANIRTMDLYEDKAGNIWIATGGGASCYNGKSFQNFTTKEGMTHNGVNTIMEDKTGKIWFGTSGDACVYDGKRFTTITTKDGKPFTNVWKIIEDKKGNIWLGGNDGLWRYDGSSFTNFTHDFVNYVYEDKKGNIWTTSKESAHGKIWALSRYDEESLSKEMPTPTEIKSGEDMFFCISEANNGSIWFGTLNGVYRYDGNTIMAFKEGQK